MQLGNIPCLFDCYLMQSQPLGNCFMDTINSWVSIPRKSGYLLFLWFRLYASFLQEHSVPACPCSWFVLLWVILAIVIPIFGGSYYILLSMLNMLLHVWLHVHQDCRVIPFIYTFVVFINYSGNASIKDHILPTLFPFD